MSLTMIEPATSWFEVDELLVVQHPDASATKDTKHHNGKKTSDMEPYFNKS